MPSLSSAEESIALGDAYTQATSSGRNALANDMDTFLTLLTTQLKNQDPLSPMDSTEFTNQLVQFAQVEQQLSQNEKLESLIELDGQSQAALAVQYIGLNVEAQSGQMPLQNGAGHFAYGVSSEAASVGIIISDSSGSIVYTSSGETEAGVHDFEWDGKDADGNQREDGIYTLSVTALDGKGASIETWTTVFGRVDGVTTEDGDTILVMGKVGVPLGDVLSVTPPPSSSHPSDGETSSSHPSDGEPSSGDSTEEKREAA